MVQGVVHLAIFADADLEETETALFAAHDKLADVGVERRDDLKRRNVMNNVVHVTDHGQLEARTVSIDAERYEVVIVAADNNVLFAACLEERLRRRDHQGRCDPGQQDPGPGFRLWCPDRARRPRRRGARPGA